MALDSGFAPFGAPRNDRREAVIRLAPRRICASRPDAVNSYQPTGCPGGRAPHLWLDDGRSLYDALGFEFTLLQLGATPIDAAPFRAAATAINMPLSVVAVASDEARELYGADLALIRPDQIVAWHGNSTSGAANVLRRAAGHI